MDKDFTFSSQNLGGSSQSVPPAPAQDNNSWIKSDKEAKDDYWRRDEGKGEDFKTVERKPFKRPSQKIESNDKPTPGLFAKYPGGVKRDMVHFFLGKGKWTDFKDNRLYQKELNELRDKYFSKDKDIKAKQGQVITSLQLQKIKRQINIDARNSVYNQGGNYQKAYKEFIKIVDKL